MYKPQLPMSRPKTDRTASEQHPWHLHGSHFWVMATGAGDYSAAEHGSSINTVNAPYRDTVSILKKGWAVIRFRVTAEDATQHLHRCC